MIPPSLRSHPLHSTAQQLLIHSRRASTWDAYGSKLDRFLSFCAEHDFQPLPADDCTILFYFAFLSDEDEVHSQSLNPYVSAIVQ